MSQDAMASPLHTGQSLRTGQNTVQVSVVGDNSKYKMGSTFYFVDITFKTIFFPDISQ